MGVKVAGIIFMFWSMTGVDSLSEAEYPLCRNS